MTDHEAMVAARKKWVRELGSEGKDWPGDKAIGGYAQGYFDALESVAGALTLLRELNDALVIPGWLQTRVDAVLDGSESGAPFASIPCEYTGGNCTRGYCRRESVCQAMENRPALNKPQPQGER